MKKERWQEISTLLDKLLTIDEASQLTYLDQHYGHDEELVQEVRDILFSISKSEENNFLESASKDHPELIKDIHDYIPEAPEPKESLIGQTVGAYEIEFMIGKGGMGSVYRARRADGQFEQSVAIKFINQQNITVVSQNRFRQEQKILANLQHPNIAMLFDGGVTEKGFPYLVMEYVEGTRIDQYCRENSLNLENRLELCKKILHTIDYAHSNLVVHRDLKPTNILVTNSGDVKILDFGIAKLMNDDTAEPAMQTAPGQRMWTPRYAAPEQVLEKSPMLQTDIYSLGMLMYELLTGASPFDLKEKSIHEVEDTIINERPRLMSETVKKMDADSIQQAFGMKKQALVNKLKTDLDAIVDKAIRKEPEHRYSSTSGFLDDINRSQNDLPVAAKKDNFSYRAGKFLRRNKQKITTAATVLLIIAGTVAFYTHRINQQRNVAEYEAAKAQEISEFLVGIFESANSYEQNGEALGLEASIGSILDHNISRLDEELGDQPELKATLNTTISKIYLRLGDFDRAENLATNAVESLSDLDGESREQLAEGLYELARVNQERGNTALADSLLLQAIEIHERSENGLVDEQALAAVSFYANLQWFNNGRFDIADSLLSGNLDIRYEHFSDNPNSIAVGHNDLAAMNHSRGHFDEAAEHYQKAIEIYTEELGDHPAVAVAMNNYAILLREYRQLEEAEKNQQKALEIHIDKQGEENIDVGLSLGNLGEIMLLNGELQKADSLTAEAMRILTDIYGDVHPYIARTALTIAKIRAQQQRFEEAETMLENVIDSYRQSYPPTHPRQSDPLYAIGEFYLTTDQPQKAEPFLSDALDIREEGFTLNNWRTAVVMSLYGEALLKNGNSSDAEHMLRESADILVNEFGEDHIYSVEAINRAAEVE